MIGTTNKIPGVKGLSTLVWPGFGPGMLLQHDDLGLLTDYTRDLSRLLFRSLFGCGVICGLEVTQRNNCGQNTITIDPGVGLLCSGDPVHVPRRQTVVLEENCAEIKDKELWVVLCASAKACSPRPSMCASDDDEMGSSATRIRGMFEVRVLPERPKCACYCEPQKKATGAGASTTELVESATATAPPQGTTSGHDCACANPADPCYADHYDGVCFCACEGGDGCCDCIVLARLTRQGDGEAATWTADHSVRRFVRPVLMRDPAPGHDTTRAAAAAQTGAEKPKAATGSGTAAKTVKRR